MKKRVLKSIAKSIFDVVKSDVIMNIEADLYTILNKENFSEDDEMCTNIAENYKRIINYYDDKYLMLLILNHLSTVIIEEDDLLIFGSYHESSIQEVIKALVLKIRTIGYPIFVNSDYIEEQDETIEYITTEFDNYINGKYFVTLAFRDIVSQWFLEIGYKHEIERKLCNRHYNEEYYFDEYMENHRNFPDFLYHHAMSIKNIENEHLKKDYPHLL